jgi:hypothetical protein
MALVFEAVYPAQRIPYPMAHAVSTENTSSTGDSPFARGERVRNRAMRSEAVFVAKERVEDDGGHRMPVDPAVGPAGRPRSKAEWNGT